MTTPIEVLPVSSDTEKIPQSLVVRFPWESVSCVDHGQGKLKGGYFTGIG